MAFLKTLLVTTVFAALPMSLQAGVEDWNGTFNILDSNGRSQVVVHTPTNIKIFSFITVKCLHVRNTTINGAFIKEINLCYDYDVDKFTSELQNIGPIINQQITLGPTYPSSNAADQ